MNNFDVIANAVASIETEMNSIKAENVTLRNRVNELEAMPKQNDVVGYIYILTNPTMPGLIKIGYADDVPARMKSLYNTSVAAPFECYAIYGVEDRLPDKSLHSLIDGFDPDLRMTDNREYYRMSPERAYSILNSIAKINSRANHLVLKPYESEEKTVEVVEEKKVETNLSCDCRRIVEDFKNRHSAKNEVSVETTETSHRENSKYSRGEIPAGFYHNKGNTAVAFVDENGEWTICRGSKCNDYITDATREYIKNGKLPTVKKYFENKSRSNVIVGGVLTEDYVCGKVSASDAATFVTLSSTNGWDFWFDEEEENIHKYATNIKK